MIEEDGTYYLLHDLDRRVWHNGGSNRNNIAIGICYTGITEPNNKQIEGIRKAIGWCEKQLQQKLVIKGHKDTYSTRCPGDTWHEWKSELD